MITLYVVLVDAVVLQIDKNAVDETYPERAARQVTAEAAERELVALGSVGCHLKDLSRPLGHGEQEDE